MKKRMNAGILTLALCMGVLTGCGGSTGVKESITETGKSTEEIVSEKAEKADLTGKSEFVKNAVPDTSKVDIFDGTVYEKMAEAYQTAADAKADTGDTTNNDGCSVFDINDDNLPEMIQFYYSKTGDMTAAIFTFDGNEPVLLVDGIPCEESVTVKGILGEPMVAFLADDMKNLKTTIYEYRMDENDVTVRDGGIITFDSKSGGYTLHGHSDYEKTADGNMYDVTGMQYGFGIRYIEPYNIRHSLRWKGALLEEPASTEGLPVLSDVRMEDVEQLYRNTTKMKEPRPVPLTFQIPLPAVCGEDLCYPSAEDAAFSVRISVYEEKNALGKPWEGYPNWTLESASKTSDGIVRKHITSGNNICATDEYMTGDYESYESNDMLQETINIYNEDADTMMVISLSYDKGYVYGRDRRVLEDLDTYRELLWDAVVAGVDANSKQ